MDAVNAKLAQMRLTGRKSGPVTEVALQERMAAGKMTLNQVTPPDKPFSSWDTDFEDLDSYDEMDLMGPSWRHRPDPDGLPDYLDPDKVFAMVQNAVIYGFGKAVLTARDRSELSTKELCRMFDISAEELMEYNNIVAEVGELFED